MDKKANKSGRKDYILMIIVSGVIILILTFLIINYNKNYVLSEKEKCEKENGVWMTGGLRTEFFCNHKMSDFGVSCADSGECEGTCLANELNPELGSCSAFKVMFGCNKELINREVQIICRD